MASSQILLVFLATTALLCLADARINPVTLCGDADYPDACNRIMKDVLGNKGAALRANIEATKVNVNSAWAEAKRLASSATDSSKSCLDAANEQYEVIVSSLNDALKAMDAKDRESLNSMLASAATSLTDIDTCYDDIGESNPLGKPNAFLKELAANNLFLYDKIKVKH